MAVLVVDEPLRDMGLTKEEFRLGSMFTRDAKQIVPGAGGTIASPFGLMKYLVAMERGKISRPGIEPGNKTADVCDRPPNSLCGFHRPDRCCGLF